MSAPGIGDPVEVLFISPGEELEVVEEWVPATVVYVTTSQVGVAFADGDRLALPLTGQSPKRWRLPTYWTHQLMIHGPHSMSAATLSGLLEQVLAEETPPGYGEPEVLISEVGLTIRYHSTREEGIEP